MLLVRYAVRWQWDGNGMGRSALAEPTQDCWVSQARECQAPLRNVTFISLGGLRVLKRHVITRWYGSIAPPPARQFQHSRRDAARRIEFLAIVDARPGDRVPLRSRMPVSEASSSTGKRPAADHDPSISPPPPKRKAQSTISSMASIDLELLHRCHFAYHALP